MLREMLIRNKRLQVFFDCVTVRARDIDNLPYRQPPVLCCEFQDTDGQFRELGDKNLLTLNLRIEALFLSL